MLKDSNFKDWLESSQSRFYVRVSNSSRSRIHHKNVSAQKLSMGVIFLQQRRRRRRRQ